MRIEFRASFLRDLERISDRRLKRRVREAIEEVEQARNLGDVKHLRKLRGSDRYYRIRVGEHRLGLSVEGEAVVFVRFLHRKDVYRYFP